MHILALTFLKVNLLDSSTLGYQSSFKDGLHLIHMRGTPLSTGTQMFHILAPTFLKANLFTGYGVCHVPCLGGYLPVWVTLTSSLSSDVSFEGPKKLRGRALTFKRDP